MSKFILPAGEYFIGDPCYSFKDSEWDKIVDLLYSENGFEKRHNFNGYVFCGISTQDGDGVFEDHEGREYGVDSGTLGAVSRALVVEQDRHKEYLEEAKLGHWVTFDEPVECGYEAGVVYFGNITIDTRGEPYPYHDDIDDEFDHDAPSYSRE